MDPDPISVFVPAHITGFFSVHREDDPVRTGSRGAGLTLTDGVHISAELAESSLVTMDGETVQIEPVEFVLEQFEIAAQIEARSDVPLGAGFGVSGAMALGTAIALNQLSERSRSTNELVSIAHVAEVLAGTGLGDVVAQARGGVPIRIEPGAPEIGIMDDIPGTGRIEYLSLGELSTEEVLMGDVGPINTAGGSALVRLRERPTVRELLRTSRTFAHESSLLTDDVEAIVEEVLAHEGEASMAMLGQTVFALETGLTDAGYDPNVCEIDICGARLDPDLGA